MARFTSKSIVDTILSLLFHPIDLCALTFCFSLYCYSPFAGSSRSASQKRNLSQGTSDDEAGGTQRPARKCTQKKKVPAQKPPAKKVAAKKGKEVRVNYRTGLSAPEYMVFRRTDCYLKPRSADVTDQRFWIPDHAFVMQDIYQSFRHPIRVMNPLKLSILKDKEAFALAANVIERMNLVPLMEICCPYSVDLVIQFMSTLVITDDPQRRMIWISGTTRAESDFHRFAQVLGYTFLDGLRSQSHRMHDERPYRDRLMGDMYYPGGIPGKLEGLKPFYSLLVRIFRSFLAPSGGNNDNLTSPLCNLLILAKQCVEDEDPTKAYPVDVMDFIFNELYSSLMGRLTIPYAPYIMLFIRRILRTFNFQELPIVDHHYKKLYVHKEKDGGDGGDRESPARGSFMRDARTSSTAAHRSTSSAAARAPRGDSALMPHVRKLSWYQRIMLCMKVDIHKAQYRSYCNEVASANNQQLILHRLSGSSDPPPAAREPESYAVWTEQDDSPWVNMSDTLQATAPTYAGPSHAQADDEEDEEEAEDEEAEADE